MLVPRSEYGPVWSKMKMQVTSSLNQSLVPIFVAHLDVDAIACTRILCALMKSEIISFQVHPVKNYGEVQKRYKEIVNKSLGRKLPFVLFINCGASVNIMEILGESDNETENSHPFLIVDSTRPIHLSNVDAKRVHILDDIDDPLDENYPLAGFEDEHGFVPLGSDEEDEDEDEDEQSDEDPSESGEEAQYPQVSEVEDSDSESRTKPKRKADKRKTKSKEISKRKKRDKRRRRRRRDFDAEADADRKNARKYYSASFCASASAIQAYTLATAINHDDKEALWMAIVGLTDQYVYRRVSHETYSHNIAFLKNELSRYPSEHDYGLDDNPNQETNLFLSNNPYMNSGKSSTEKSAGSTHIIPTSDLRLELFRHTSLFDSLVYSSYIAAKIGSWRQTGRRLVQELLAGIGIPLKDAQQKWAYLSSMHRDMIRERLAVVAAERLDLHEIEYPTFYKTLKGYQGALCPWDLVLVVSQLINASSEQSDSGLAEGDFASAETYGEPGNNDDLSSPLSLPFGGDDFSADVEAKFWKGYDALSNRSDGLSSGIEQALSVQRVIQSEVSQILERRRFVSSGSFRYSFLRQPQNPHLTEQPLVLARIAIFLQLILESQNTKRKPFVIIAPLRNSTYWRALAVTSSNDVNRFGMQFRLAAIKAGAIVRQDTFHMACVDIPNGKEMDVIRYMHDTL